MGEPRPGEERFATAPFRRRLREREPAAWEAVYEAFAGLVLGAAHRVLPPRLDPEAAAQDAWVLAIHRIHRLDPALGLVPWLVTLCVNHCISVLRRDRALQRIARLRRAGRAEGSGDGNPGHDGEASRVRRGVARLPRSLQQILYLRYACDMRTLELSRVLGLSEPATRKRLSRAYARLRAVLDGGERLP